MLQRYLRTGDDGIDAEAVGHEGLEEVLATAQHSGHQRRLEGPVAGSVRDPGVAQTELIDTKVLHAEEIVKLVFRISGGTSRRWTWIDGQGKLRGKRSWGRHPQKIWMDANSNQNELLSCYDVEFKGSRCPRLHASRSCSMILQ